MELLLGSVEPQSRLRTSCRPNARTETAPAETSPSVASSGLRETETCCRAASAFLTYSRPTKTKPSEMSAAGIRKTGRTAAMVKVTRAT